MAAALLLVGLLGIAPASVTALESHETPGCLVRNFVYNDRLRDASGKPRDPLVLKNLDTCQEACNTEPACTEFGYFPDSQQCYLGGGNGTQKESPGGIAGTKNCVAPVPACTTAVPNLAKFLTATTAEKAQASWSTGYQPHSLQCWPDIGTAPCADISVLEDTAKGWTGLCESLIGPVELADGQTCEMNCFEDMACSVYQLTKAGECWKGLGLNCFSKFWRGEREMTVQVERSKRVQRGQVRMLSSLVGKRIAKGMLQVFDQENAKLTPDPAIACKNVCLSAKHCQVWQLRNSTGCYIEAVDTLRDTHWKLNPYPANYDNKAVPYPLMFEDPDSIDHDVLAGELLQKSCATVLVPAPTPTPPTPAPTLATMAPAPVTITLAPGVDAGEQAKSFQATLSTTAPTTTATLLLPGFVSQAPAAPSADISGTTVSTFMTTACAAGTTVLPVSSNVGFVVGREVRVGDEVHTISALGSIVLGSPLLKNWPAGTAVVLLAAGGVAQAPVAPEEEAGFAWWAWLLIILALVVCLGALTAFFVMRGKGRKATSRGVRGGMENGDTSSARNLEQQAYPQPPASFSYAAPAAYAAAPTQPLYTTPHLMPMAQNAHMSPEAAADALFDQLDQGHNGVLTRQDFERMGLVQPTQLAPIMQSFRQY